MKRFWSSRFARRLRSRKVTVFWMGVLFVIAVSAVFAPWVAPHDPYDGDLLNTLSRPSADHWLGTDQIGRDILSRLIYGSRAALIAAVQAVGIAVVLGIPIGLISGYRGGWLDTIVQRSVEAIIAIPFLILAVALISILGPGLWKSMVVVGVIYATFMIRLTRGETLAVRENEYVDSARVAGQSEVKIIIRHVLPNLAPPLIVQVTLLFATAIIVEATLSFLGLGTQPPTPSWGSMLSEAQAVIRSDFYQAIPPGVVIVITVLALNQFGDGLRDLFGRADAGGSLGTQSVEKVETLAAVPDVDPAASAGVGGAGASRTIRSARPDPSGETIAGGAPTVDAVLSVSGLSVTFPGPDRTPHEVVRNVSFEVAKGEVLGLVGESGSGKSVTALSCLGLVPSPGKVTASRIELDGQDLVQLSYSQFSKIRGRQVGVVFQEPIAALNPAFTVGDQVSEVLRFHLRMSRAEAARRTVELFDMVRIPKAKERMRDYPHQFSGGMAQRVSIAMALSTGPKLLIADEPTTALDVTVQGQVLELMLDLKKELGMSILLITHDLGVVAETADRLAVMYCGQIAEIGGVNETLHSPMHPYTAGLLASVPRNERRTGPLQSIPGVVPPPWEFGDGCAFAPRCPHAEDLCTTGTIRPEVVDGRVTACRRSGEVELRGVDAIESRPQPRSSAS